MIKEECPMSIRKKLRSAFAGMVAGTMVLSAASVMPVEFGEPELESYAAGVSKFAASMTSDGNGLTADTDAPVQRDAITPDANSYYYHDTFENGTDDWEGRGGASVSTSGGTAYAGSKALTVFGRGSSWHGAMKSLDPLTFKAGETYSFSVAASGSGNMMLSLQYTDASGETKYDHIANGGSSGDYVQLANPDYRLPDGSNFILYVETEDGTSSFTIDEAIVAKAGTQIDGPKPVKVIPGDINGDERVDSFDVILARKGAVNGLTGAALKAGDVDGDGKMAAADLVQIAEFVLGQRKNFEKGSSSGNENPDPSEFMASIRNSITVDVPASALASAGGTVEHITYFSKKANRSKGANVWLPPGYDSSRKYPVFYVNHGYGGDENAMLNGMGVREIATNLIKSGEAEPMIIVFTNQYTDPRHEKQTGNGQADVPGYDNFVEDLPDSLMPYIESHYPVKTGRENTAVAVFSMGGRESLYIGIRCSDKVGYIGAGAPAPGIFPTRDQIMDHPGVMSKEDMRIDAPYSPYLLMIAGGTNDGMVGTYPKQYSDLFTEHGTENIYISVPGGGHDGKTVIPLMYNFIKNLFKAV